MECKLVNELLVRALRSVQADPVVAGSVLLARQPSQPEAAEIVRLEAAAVKKTFSVYTQDLDSVSVPVKST
jgi:hypothetical protein